MRTFSILFSLAFAQTAHAECVEPTGVVGPIRRFNAGQDYHRCLISELEVDMAELRALVGTLNERVTATEGSVDELYECIDECSEPIEPDTEITIWFTDPVDTSIDVGGNNEVVLSFCVESTREVTVKDLSINLFGDDSGDGVPGDEIQDVIGFSRSDWDGLIGPYGANLTDLKLTDRASGSVVMGPLELRESATDNDAKQAVAFTDDFWLQADEALCLDLEVDVSGSPSLAGAIFLASLDVSGLVIEDENGDVVPAINIVPSSDIVGRNMRVIDSSEAL
jgi:hypothetical protein